MAARPPRSGPARDLDLRFRVRRSSGSRPDRPLLRRLCEAVLRGERVGGPVRLTVTLTDDEEIRRLNLRHRGLDRPTDVLSFPLLDAADADFVLPPGAPRELGDIVVSYPRALAQAAEYGHSPARELGYLVAHGLLHILGHDHHEATEQRIMRAREESALAEVGLFR